MRMLYFWRARAWDALILDLLFESLMDVMMNRMRTRFAPSPSGRLHLGHVFAACVARSMADVSDGECLLRMEDIDLTRCRSEYVQGILEDMAWLGIRFDGEIVFQSQRFERYQQALSILQEMGVVYPCFCTRRQVAAELERVGRAPQGELVDAYPGTCRRMSFDERLARMVRGDMYSWRLDCRVAGEIAGVLNWVDLRRGSQVCHPERIGDVILSRKDCPAGYHLCVVIDDAEQGVTHVTRGEDLFEVTHLHRLLQELLHLPVPVWYHHDLILDDHGVRLAKRNDSKSLLSMRQQGVSPQEIMNYFSSKLSFPVL